jgi:hypothetical protein
MVKIKSYPRVAFGGVAPDSANGNPDDNQGRTERQELRKLDI